MGGTAKNTRKGKALRQQSTAAAPSPRGELLAREFSVMPVAQMQPHPRNPRMGDVHGIRFSMERNGWFGAVIVQKSSGYILAGSHRWQAAKEGGVYELPAIVLDVDDAAALRILLADNRTSDQAGYDDSALLKMLEAANGLGGLPDTLFFERQLQELDAKLHPQDAALGADDSLATKVPVTIGRYRFAVPVMEFEAWKQRLETQCGSDKTLQIAELRKRLSV